MSNLNFVVLYRSTLLTEYRSVFEVYKYDLQMYAYR